MDDFFVNLRSARDTILDIPNVFQRKLRSASQGNVPEVTISKSPRHTFRAISDYSAKDLENRQSMDQKGDSLDSRYYNYIPFSFEDETGTQYGLIQTPSFNDGEVSRVFLDNGLSWGPREAMKFISSAKDKIFIPDNRRSYWFNDTNVYKNKKTAPSDWLNNMRKRYIESYPDSIYADQASKNIIKYETTGEL